MAKKKGRKQVIPLPEDLVELAETLGTNIKVRETGETIPIAGEVEDSIEVPLSSIVGDLPVSSYKQFVLFQKLIDSSIPIETVEKYLPEVAKLLEGRSPNFCKTLGQLLNFIEDAKDFKKLKKRFDLLFEKSDLPMRLAGIKKLHELGIETEVYQDKAWSEFDDKLFAREALAKVIYNGNYASYFRFPEEYYVLKPGEFGKVKGTNWWFDFTGQIKETLKSKSGKRVPIAAYSGPLANEEIYDSIEERTVVLRTKDKNVFIFNGDAPKFYFVDRQGNVKEIEVEECSKSGLLVIYNYIPPKEMVSVVAVNPADKLKKVMNRYQLVGLAKHLNTLGELNLTEEEIEKITNSLV